MFLSSRSQRPTCHRNRLWGSTRTYPSIHCEESKSCRNTPSSQETEDNVPKIFRHSFLRVRAPPSHPAKSTPSNIRWHPALWGHFKNAGGLLRRPGNQGTYRIVTYLCLLLTPSIQDFIPCLKDFALCKILSQEYDFDEVSFSEAERTSITFVKNKIYQHKVMWVNYTTYNMRREQDSLNPRTHANIMVLSQEKEPDAHPYKGVTGLKFMTWGRISF